MSFGAPGSPGTIADAVQVITSNAAGELYSVSANASVILVFGSSDGDASWTWRSSFSSGAGGGTWAGITAELPYPPRDPPCAPLGMEPVVVQ